MFDGKDLFRAMNSGNVLLLMNDEGYYSTHQQSLVRALNERGLRTVLVMKCDDGSTLSSDTVRVVQLPPGRGVTPLRDLRVLSQLISLYRSCKPEVVHHFALKNVLLGSMAAMFSGRTTVVNAVTGLGFVFIENSIGARVLKFLVCSLMRLLCTFDRYSFVFQNRSDLETLLGPAAGERKNIHQIPGSGVDLQKFRPAPEPPGPLTVILPARILWHKGVGEFVSAARMLKARHPLARFVLVGANDPGNPSSVPDDQLKAWRDEGVVQCWGHRTDMPEVMALSHVVVLPSYREGMPKVLAEAGACRRPVIASNVPGCREIVRHGRNGLLVEPRSAESLAKAIDTLLGDPPLRATMGRAGREIVESEFSDARIVALNLRAYGLESRSS